MSKLFDLDHFVTQKKIVLKATISQLNDLKNIVPSLKNHQLIIEKANDIFELSPPHTPQNAPKLLDLIKMSDLSKENEKNDEIIDFKNSTEFYKKSKSKNQFKIITDEFSQQRNEKLYSGFYLIESKLRLLITDEIFSKNPENYQNESPDHKISQYTLSEVMEDCLLKPASEQYLKEQWAKCNKTEDNMIAISKLKKIDELDLPLTAKELELMRKTRNKCMHFRVVTVDEYCQTIENINKYLIIQSQKEFIKVMQETLKPIQDAIINIGSALTQTFRIN